MSNYVKISCIGPAPYPVSENDPVQQTVEGMIDHWRRQLDQVLSDRPDIIVLPEACDRPRGYSIEKRFEYYDARQHRFRDLFAEIAAEHGCHIVYPSHIRMEDGTWRNAAQFIGREGRIIGEYYKNHLVIEENTLTDIGYGTEAPVIGCDFGRVACAICFDLNFEELRRQYAELRPDLIVFPSMYHGGLMQNYWAYSCRSYFAGAIAGMPCTIVSPLGEILASSTNYYNFVTATVNMDYKVIHIDHNGKHFAEMKRKYGSRIRIHDPGFVGMVLLTSETDEFDVEEIVQEFGLEPVEQYFQRSLTHRCETALVGP